MKIPPEAKEVFKGKIFSVYQWEQEMYDGSHEIFEMLKRPDTVEVIATAGDKIYMSHQSQPNKQDFDSLFGGRTEDGEDPLDAVKRELLEESGMTSENWELFKTYEPVHKLDWTIYTYIARNCQKVAEQKLDVGEKIEIRTYDFDQFVDIVLAEKYWGSSFAFDLLRMKEAGTLDAFKQKLFQK